MNNDTHPDTNHDQAHSGMPTSAMPAGGGHGGPTPVTYAAGSSAATPDQTAGSSAVTSAIKDKAEQAKHMVSQQAGEVMTQAQTEAQKAREIAAAKAEQVKGQAKTAANQFLDSKKQRVTGELSVLQDAISRATDQLRENRHDSVAQYTAAAADKIDALRRGVESRDIDGIIDDVQSFARRQPALVFGGLFVAGLVAARFLKASSAERTERQLAHRAYGNGHPAGGGGRLEIPPHQATRVDTEAQY